MDRPLVSVITPCYNGENVMHRLLDSILAQTYANMEFILVNDGSTDRSEEVWNTYCDRFEKRGIRYQYIYQKNQGLGAAINTGLKHMTGEYFCWPDIDDYLDPASVEKRLNFLQDNPEFAAVSSDAYIYQESDLNNPVGTAAEWMEHKFDENQFFWMLKGQSLYCSGCHMLRTKYFLDVNPKRRIYPARRGQNNQLLLPVYYKYKRGFIDQPLYHYIIYRQSMSAPDESIDSKADREREYAEILKWSVNQISMSREDKKICQRIMDRNTWKNWSEIYVRSRAPLKYICLYLRMRIFATPESKTIKGIVRCFQFPSVLRKHR